MFSSCSGVWFYGLAGSGKTFASNVVATMFGNSFIIDGDEVRKLISFDLNYTSEDRKIQLQRMLGLAELTIKNAQFPILSTVSMNSGVFAQCQAIGLQVVEIVRPRNQIFSARQALYKDSKNVVGKDIVQENLNTKRISNDGSNEFKKLILKHG